MKVLGIETAGMVGGVAFLEDNAILAEQIFEKGMVHGREIAPAVQRICQSTGIALGKIDLVAVDIGPGSYTGLRVGLAAAKALAFALGCGIYGVSSLDAMAEAVSAEAPLCAVLDARWEEVYGAIYDPGQPPRRRGDCLAENPDDFLRRVPTGAIAFGDAAGRYRDRFQAAGVQIAPEDLWHPKPSMIARIAAREVAAGKSADLTTLVPMYLRSTGTKATG